jgi:hypothetical protein
MPRDESLAAARFRTCGQRAGFGKNLTLEFKALTQRQML